jgi:hypothetical protein
MYDPATKKITTLDVCFSTHHLNFDKNGVIWFSSGSTNDPSSAGSTPRSGTDHDEQASQGWAPFIIDTNGNGKADEYVEPNSPSIRKRQARAAGLYSVSANPSTVRFGPSCSASPDRDALRSQDQADRNVRDSVNDPKNPDSGFSPRGADVTTDGVLWRCWRAVISRVRPAPVQGPLERPAVATGKACPEGGSCTRFRAAVPRSCDEGGSAESPYYDWVDQFDTLGLGKNTPIAHGQFVGCDVRVCEWKFVTMRVPYPMGFFSKGMDGRIDDPNGGWKGRGCFCYLRRQLERTHRRGQGQTPKVVHFQLRPDPLAK